MKRRLCLQWGCACGAALAAGAWAQTPWSAPARFTRPAADQDEGGLWAMMDREETRVRRSPFRLREEALNSYLSDAACKLGAEHCPDIRVYAVRMPYFNASMAPNGMMQIWSGLLLRMDNEAQLGAIIAHEIGHYLQRHSLERLRDAKARSAFAVAMVPFGLIGLVSQLVALGGAYAYSRDQEREADRISIALLRAAGYDPREAAKVWVNLLQELKANPEADPTKESVLFATHPPSEERRAELERLAAGETGITAEEAYRAQLAPVRMMLLEDEIKRGRWAESVELLNRLLARAPEDAELLYFRGEALRGRGQSGDAALALADYQAAIRFGKEPAATHRAIAELYKSMNQPDAAREAWQHYLSAAPDAADAALIRQHIGELR